jgi:hypothetical protein
MLGPQELPMAIHWEQVRLRWYQQQGHHKAAEECRKCLERLEARLWDEETTPEESP